jgi:glutaminyl-tRNA synthetase
VIKLQVFSFSYQAAIKFVENVQTIDIDAFNEACGVGIVISLEEIREAVKNLIIEKKSDLDTKRYQLLGLFLGQLKNNLKWANAMAVKEELDAQMLAYLGPKDERDNLKAAVIIY